MDDKQFLDIIKADNLGQVPDSTGASYLPKEIADKIIKQLLEENFVRRIFPKVTIPTNVRNLTVPAIIHGYWIW